MIINHNISALNTYRQLSSNNVMQNKSLEKLSSGLRINRAGDDAAGLAISEKMRAQIRGLEMAGKNAQDGISLIQTAEGALTESHAILQRMRELAVQSANDTNVSVDRTELQKEVDQLAQELTRIANNTEFNTQTLLNGGITTVGLGEVKFHIGANAGQDISLAINAMDAKSLGVARDTMAASVTAGSNIAGVNIDSIYGEGIIEEAEISFTYASATAGSVTATGAYAGAAGSATLEFKVDGGSAKSVTITSNMTATQLVNAINAAATGIATLSSGRLTLTSTTNGKSSSIEILETSTGLERVKLKAGVYSGAEDSFRLSDGTVSQTVDVSPSDTSISVTTGYFKGLSITLADGKAVSNLDGTDKITVSIEEATAAKYNAANKAMDAAVAKAGIGILSQEDASKAITIIQTAIETVSAERSKLGAVQNRLEHTINNLGASAENLTAAESRIRDVDMAKEMMEFTKMNILSQAATAMLAQANQQPQMVLQLLR